MERTRLSVLLLIPLSATIVLIGPLWLNSELPVFRDAGHFYYPSFHYEHELWKQGHVPLWSSLDDLGRPFAADSSASVFYPGKLIFWLPLSFASCMLLYLTAHILLAAVNTYYLARRWNTSAAGAVLASLSYSLGGAVLTQHSNIIYLVSAAWLPLAICLALDLLQKQNCHKSITFLAVTLALMVLGGDAQMALHVILLVPLLYWFSGRRAKRDNHASIRQIASRTVAKRILLTSLLAFALAAIQVLPTYQWSKSGSRKMRSASRTTYEWVYDQVREKSLPSDLFQGGAKSEHHGQLYQFSLAPWQLGELLLPNVTGKLYPERHRWTFLFDDNPRTWYPSIYQGILPILLCLSCFGISRNAPHKQLSRLILFALLASLGSFGVGWLLRAFTGSELIADETGGIYWLLCNTVPGYIQFRYPAKWFVIVSLLISILAGLGWDSKDTTTQRKQTIFNWSAVGICATLLACYPLLSQLLSNSLADAPADSFLGPIIASGSRQDLLIAAAQPLFIVLGFITLSKVVKPKRIFKGLVLALLACDLIFANSWLFSSSPSYQWDAVSNIDSQVKDSTRKNPARVYRARLSRWNPPSFTQTSSQDRQRDALLWDRQSLRPRMHLLSHIQSLDANASISDAHYDSVLRVMRRHGRTRRDGIREPDINGLALLGVSHIIAPDKFIPGTDAATTKPTDVEDVLMTAIDHSAPFAWTVPNWKMYPPFIPGTPKELDRKTTDIFYPDGKLADLANLSTLESETLSSSSQPVRNEKDRIELELFEPGFVRLRVFKQERGPLIINQGFAPGWKARIWNSSNTLAQPTPVFRANRIMQGIMLEQGEQTVDLIYRPDSFMAGLVISCLGWLILCLQIARTARREHRNRTK